jgi:hypothetical protein
MGEKREGEPLTPEEWHEKMRKNVRSLKIPYGKKR